MKKTAKTAETSTQAARNNSIGYQTSRETDYLLHSIVQGFSIPAFVIGKEIGRAHV
jgi:hypothetical protein